MSSRVERRRGNSRQVNLRVNAAWRNAPFLMLRGRRASWSVSGTLGKKQQNQQNSARERPSLSIGSVGHVQSPVLSKPECVTGNQGERNDSNKTKHCLLPRALGRRFLLQQLNRSPAG